MPFTIFLYYTQFKVINDKIGHKPKNYKYAFSDFLFVVKGRINNLGVIFLARGQFGWIINRDFGGNGTPELVQP